MHSLMLPRPKGFTFPELMIVVALILILTAITIPNLLRARLNANDTSAQATLKTIAAALENYAAANRLYATDPDQLLGVNPPYLNEDFFTGTHNGFTFTYALSSYAYTIVATPINSALGSRSFTITTGAVLQ